MKKEWKNYGDVNFMEYGGCLVKEFPNYPNAFYVMSLTTEVYCECKYKKPMIVARCFIDLEDWLNPNDDQRKEVNKNAGYKEDYIPYTLDEKMSYCVDLINHLGIHEFDPVFPEETGCGPYGLGTLPQWIVGKTIAQRFMKEYGVPYQFRR